MPSDSFKKSRRIKLSLDLEAAEPLRQQMRNCLSPLAADGVGASPFHPPPQSSSTPEISDLASFTRLPSNLTLCAIQGVGEDSDSTGGQRSGLAHSQQHGGSSITLLSPNGGAFLSSGSPLVGLAGGGMLDLRAYQTQSEMSYLHHVPTTYSVGSNSNLVEMPFVEEETMGPDTHSPLRGAFACSTTSSHGVAVDYNLAATIGIDTQLEGSDESKAYASFRQSLSLPVEENDDTITPFDSAFTRIGNQQAEPKGSNPLFSPITSPQLPAMLPPSIHQDPFPDTTGRSVHRTISHPISHSTAPVHHHLIHRCESLPALSATPNPHHRHFSNTTFTNNSSLSDLNWMATGNTASTPNVRQGSSPVGSSQILTVPLPIDANPADIINLGTPLFSTMGALANNAGFDLLDTKSYKLVHDAYLGSGNGGTVRRVKRVPVSLGYFLASPENNSKHPFHHGNLAFSQCDVFGSILPSPSRGNGKVQHQQPIAEVPSQQTTPSSQTTHTPPAASSRSHTSIAGNPGNGNVSSNSIPFKSPPSPGERSSSEVEIDHHNLPTNSSTESSPNVAAAVSGLLKASRRRRDRLASTAGPILRRETMQCPAAQPEDLTAGSPENASTAIFNSLPAFPPSRGGSIVEVDVSASPPTQQGRRTDSNSKGSVVVPSSRRGTLNGGMDMPQILSTNASFMSVGSSHLGCGSAKGAGGGDDASYVLSNSSGGGFQRHRPQISLPSANLNRAASLSPANSGSFFSTRNTPNVQSVPSNHRLSQYSRHTSGPNLISPTATAFSGPTYFALKEINLNSQERVEEIQRELKNLVASHRYYYYPTDAAADSELSPRNRRRKYKRRTTSRRGSLVPFTRKNAVISNNGSSSATTTATTTNLEGSTSPLSRSLSPQQRVFHKRGGGAAKGPWASFGSGRSVSCMDGALERTESKGSKSGEGGGYVPYPVSCNNVVDYFGAFQNENTIVIVMELLDNSVDALLKSHMRRHDHTTTSNRSGSPIGRNYGSSSSMVAESGSPVNGRPPLAPPPVYQHAEKSTTPPRSPSFPTPPKMEGLPLRWIALIARDVLRGLLFLHKVRTLVHRDLKPGNLLFTTDPTVGARRTQATPQASPLCGGIHSTFSDPLSNNASTTMAPSALVKIADFGVSHEFNGDIAGGDIFAEKEEGNDSANPPPGDTTTAFIGSVSYMSPERLRNDPYGYPSDIWSLGILLLELATGTHPFNNALTKNGQRSVASLRQEERFWCILSHLGRDESWTKSELACSSSSTDEGCLNEGDATIKVDDDTESCSHNITHLLLPQECRATCPVFADFIERALSKNPERRATAGELLRHPFLLMHCDHDRGVLAEIGSLFHDELTDFTERTGVSVYELLPGVLPARRSQSSTPGSSTIHMTDPRTPKTHNIPQNNPFSNSPFAHSKFDHNYGPMTASVDGSYANEGGASSYISKNRSSIVNPPTRSQSLTEHTAITSPSTLPQMIPAHRNSALGTASEGGAPSQSHDELPNFARGFGLHASCDDTAALLGFRRRSSVIVSPSAFSFSSTPGHVSHGLSGGTGKDFVLESDSNPQSQHRTSIVSGADSQQGSYFFRRRATSSAAAEDVAMVLPLPGDTVAMDDDREMSHSSLQVDAPFHLAPPLPKFHGVNPPEALNILCDTDAPSLTAVMTRHKEEEPEEGGDQLVLAAFRETMQPVDTDHLHLESEQAAYSSANQARMMRMPTSDDGEDSPTNAKHMEQPTLLSTALRVRNVMVSLLTGNQSIEQPERAELALYIRSTLSSK